MPAKSLRDLFVEELPDMYDGEKRLVRALPKVAKAAEAAALKTAFTSHLKETEKQVRRLEQVFRSVGETRRAAASIGLAQDRSRSAGRQRAPKPRRSGSNRRS